MSAARRIRTETKHTYTLDTGTTLPVAWNPDNDWFRPVRLVVEIEQSPYSREHVVFTVFGPILRNGKPLKTKSGHLNYTLDQFLPDFPIENQRAPLWLRRIAEELGLIATLENIE